MFTITQKNRPKYITEDIDRKSIFSCYDNHHGLELIVNATEKEVIVPEKFRNETKMHLLVTRDTVESISFDDDTFSYKINSSGTKFEYKIPYKNIRKLKVVKNSNLNFWKKHQERKYFYSFLLNAIAWIYVFIVSICSLYIVCTNIQFFDYSFFQLTRRFWNSEITVFFYKLVALLCSMYEFIVVVVILLSSPIMVLSEIFHLKPLWSELLYVSCYFMIGIWKYLHGLFSEKTPQKTSIMELNLELLGLRPIFRQKKFNIRNDFCFYVGPFSESYTNIYNDNILKPIKTIGLQIQRADEIFGTMPVMEDIWNVLNECSIVIAEISGRNPNVMYEIGMAHTIGKKVILITQNASDIPFDLRHHRCILYENTENGRETLESKLLSTIKYELDLKNLH
ncbi:MAG: hypothetical protein HQK72_11730 [Desulfamplus sp.]|nr:hypothetical protein [Desulfamplus sp.]